MKHLFLIVIMGLIASCITPDQARKRAYDYMLTDTFRDNQERAKLSRGYFSEFPFYKDTPSVKVTFDSTAYNDYIYNTNMLLDQNIKFQERIDSLEALPRYDSTGKKLPPKQKCKPSFGDSSAIVKAFLAAHPPPPIDKNTSKETPIKTDGKLAEAEKSLSECRAENEKLTASEKAAVKNAEDKKQTNTWLWIVLGLLVAGNIVQILNKVKL